MRVSAVVGSVVLTGVLSTASFAQSAGAVSRNQRAIVRSDSIDFGAVSASPNGKWLALEGAIRGRSSIWVVSVNGGELHRITDGPHDDLFPIWFPSGDRLAFAGNRVRGIMAVEIDPERGTAVGALKRISIEPTRYFDISPDGRQIVYLLEPNADGKSRVRIAPANSGVAKTIYEEVKHLSHPRFSPDGRTVFFTTWRTAPTVDRFVERVSVNGGSAVTVPMSQGAMAMAYPARDRMAITTQRGLIVRTIAGDSIATAPVVRATIHRDFSPDGRVLYQPMSEVAASIRLISTTGGPTIDMTSPSAPGYHYPGAWTTTNRLFYSGGNDRTDSIFERSIGSERAEAYSLTPVNPLDGWKPTPGADVSADGRYVMMKVSHPGGRRLYLFELATRRLTEVAKEAVGGAMTTADWTHPEAFYFFEKSGSGFQLKAVRGGEAARVIATLPPDASLRLGAIVGGRVLYRKQVGDSTQIFSVSDAGGAPIRVATLPGSVSALYPSHDGRWLAGPTSVGSSAGGEQRVMFLPLGADGMPAGPPRFVKTDIMWDLAWTPDNRAVIGLEEEGMSSRTRVRRIPVDPKERTAVLGPTNTTFWDAYLSPDGKYVAIPVEHGYGSTLWAFDLPAAPNTKR